MTPEIVILHCSDSPDKGDFIGAKEIDEWHRARGWSKIGYHYVIRRSGVLEYGRPNNKQGAHCQGHNSKSLGICLVGRYVFTDLQWKALHRLYLDIKDRWGIDAKSWYGHREFNKDKTCPNLDCDDVRDILSKLTRGK